MTRMILKRYVPPPPLSMPMMDHKFNGVAEIKGWNRGDKLEELLPRLQGAAGEFVYGQLSPKIWRNYKELVSELENRFRVVETEKTYRATFRRQVRQWSPMQQN